MSIENQPSLETHAASVQNTQGASMPGWRAWVLSVGLGITVGTTVDDRIDENNTHLAEETQLQYDWYEGARDELEEDRSFLSDVFELHFDDASDLNLIFSSEDHVPSPSLQEEKRSWKFTEAYRDRMDEGFFQPLLLEDTDISPGAEAAVVSSQIARLDDKLIEDLVVINQQIDALDELESGLHGSTKFFLSFFAGVAAAAGALGVSRGFHSFEHYALRRRAEAHANELVHQQLIEDNQRLNEIEGEALQIIDDTDMEAGYAKLRGDDTEN